MLEEDLVGMSRELATSIKDLVHAQRDSPTALAKVSCCFHSGMQKTFSLTSTPGRSFYCQLDP
jgi:hypothetical protein